jgi:hypothetical protein
MRKLFCFVVIAGSTLLAAPKEKTNEKPIPPQSKVYIAPMDGFETDLSAALEAKKVPLQLVPARDQADYEIKGTAESQKAGAAKKIIMGSWHSKEEASIQVFDVKSSEMVYAYSYHNDNSMHGKKSAAESVAKHLKDKVESSK